MPKWFCKPWHVHLGDAKEIFRRCSKNLSVSIFFFTTVCTRRGTCSGSSKSRTLSCTSENPFLPTILHGVGVLRKGE